MKTHQIFLSSRNRDAGTPNDMFITFRNGLIKDLSTATVPPETSIELVEVAITRLWYEVQIGIIDTFQVYQVADQRTFTTTLAQGWYTFGQDTAGCGVAIEPILANLLTATVGGVRQVIVDNQLGVFSFHTPAAGGSGYSFNFPSPTNRCNDLLGFNNLVYLAVNDVIAAPKPFHLTRT
jgi:hypothetical protein